MKILFYVKLAFMYVYYICKNFFNVYNMYTALTTEECTFKMYFNTCVLMASENVEDLHERN